jgi:hypothetical protein
MFGGMNRSMVTTKSKNLLPTQKEKSAEIIPLLKIHAVGRPENDLAEMSYLEKSAVI